MNDSAQPCLVDTGQGLSVLYRDRYLYSRYAPAKQSEVLVHSLTAREQTLFYIPSPLLGYGISSLLQNLPVGCAVIAVEIDQALHRITDLSEAIKKDSRFCYLHSNSYSAVLNTVTTLPGWPFRRCVRLDLSNGASLHEAVYQNLLFYLDNAISAFWKNQLTLVRLGRNYFRNIFRNLPAATQAAPLLPDSIGKTIMIAGAGPSLEKELQFISANRRRLFVLCVDTALPVIGAAGITPDAVLVVESQIWIEDAFAGFKGSGIPVIADLTSRSAASRITGGPVSWCASLFTKCSLFDRLAALSLLPLPVEPLGSVGLLAVELALQLRQEGTAVICAGLDFSFGAGYTHARGAPATRNYYTSRFNPPGSPPPQLRSGVRECAPGLFTETVLDGYATLFRARYSRAPGLYQLGEGGLPLGIPSTNQGTALALINEASVNSKPQKSSALNGTITPLRLFLEEERARLNLLRGLCTGEIESAEGELPLEQIEKLLKECDYLYLYFADGYKGPQLESSFLNRIRTGIDFFLKTIDIALRETTGS